MFIGTFAPMHAALPNPSLKRSANGRPPWPGLRYAVHCLSPGQGVLPPLPRLARTLGLTAGSNLKCNTSIYFMVAHL